MRPAGEEDGRDEGGGREKKDNDTEGDFGYNRHEAVSLCGGCIGAMVGLLWSVDPPWRLAYATVFLLPFLNNLR